MIPFCTKLDACILNEYVEADHNWVGFDCDITCDSGYIPIIGMFTRVLIMGTFPKILVRKGNE